MPEYYVGLMSGTSMDGIDAALVDFTDSRIKLLACHNKSWPENLFDKIIATQQLSDHELKSLDSLDNAAGELFADATNELLNKANINPSQVIAIGSHGQTIRHRPEGETPFSLQIGNAALISKLTNIKVISNFRTADIKAGGEGAPLAPAFHNAVFRDATEDRMVINIGGIANLTVLPADAKSDVIGFDSGPGNTLMDAWIRRHKNVGFDGSGNWAASGKIDEALLQRLLQDDYFAKAAPKSTGLEYFHLKWLETFLNDSYNAGDVQATLCELTAISIADAVKRYNPQDRILICGGGYHNQHLIARLQNQLAGTRIESTETIGVHPDWVEAMAFAWLARQTINNEPGNLPSVTGATSAVVLGNVTGI